MNRTANPTAEYSCLLWARRKMEDVPYCCYMSKCIIIIVFGLYKWDLFKKSNWNHRFFSRYLMFCLTWTLVYYCFCWCFIVKYNLLSPTVFYLENSKMIFNLFDNCLSFVFSHDSHSHNLLISVCFVGWIFLWY